ncbi:MAG: TIGR02302 family protein, partial [Pseudomonadota bacterium]
MRLARRSRAAAQDEQGLKAHIESVSRKARLALAWESLWPRLVPALGVVLVFLSASFLGFWRVVDGWVQIACLVLLAIAFLAALLPLRGFRQASRDAARARVEAASGLDHAPLRSLEDEIGSAETLTVEGSALWRAHLDRLRARVTGLRAGRVSPRLDRRDPYALRGGVLLVFGLAVLVGWGDLTGRVGEAFRFTQPVEAAAARVDAWISPPTYTGRAPLVITDIEGIVTVPEGSVVTVRSVESIDVALEGANGTVPLEMAETPGALRGFEGRIEAASRLVVTQGEAEARAWTIDVVPDDAPSIAFLDPGLAEAERGQGLRLTYEMSDDYGVTGAQAVVAPVEAEPLFPWAAGERAAPRPLYDVDPIRLALPRGRKDGTGQTVRDLSEHPFAGTRVSIHLEATDAADQTARSDAQEIVLPGREMRSPLARAVMEQARVLARDANAAERVLSVIDVMTLDPEADWPDTRAYLGMRSAYWRLDNAASDDALRDVVDFLQQIAIGIDDGSLSAAQRDLLAAQEALRDALDRGASDEELAALMDELRQAMQRAMEEMLANAQPMQPGQQPPTQPMDLSEFLDQLDDAVRSGQRDQAEQMLSQLEQMMRDMMNGQMQAAPQNGLSQQFSEAMDELAEMMRRQQELMDETFQSQQQRPQGSPGELGEPQGGEQQLSPEEFAEAMEALREQQQALQEALEGLAEQMEGLGIEPGELGEAGEARGRAERQLGRGEAGRAVGPQGEALDALRQAGRSMAQQMQQMMQ